jgi:hypothetical protein
MKSDTGRFSTLDECSAYVHKYAVDSSQDICVQQPGGKFESLDECFKYKRYSLMDGACVPQPDGDYATLMSCKNVHQ